MASKTTLNAKNLEALGAERLAELLIEISSGSAATKRRLRLELLGMESPGKIAQEVRKRLSTITRSRSFVDWQNRRVLVNDLETQRRAIIEQVAKADPAEALGLLWRFLALGNSIFERCDDSSGTVIGIFHHTCEDLGEIAKTAKIDRKQLADRAFQALTENDYGQYDRLITVLAPALGREGLDHLKDRIIVLSNQPVRKPPEEERQVIGRGSGGPIYADETAERFRASTVRLALQERSPTPWATSMPLLSSMRKKPGGCRRSPRKSRSASLQPAGHKRHGRRSRQPSIGNAAVVGTGRTSLGKMLGSTSSKRSDAPMMPKPHVGSVLNAHSRRPISGHI